jgi:SPP1 gp7 family putative phage head morphogenesis protein
VGSRQPRLPLPDDGALITRTLWSDSEALRIAESWVRRRIYGLEKEQARALYDLYLQSYRELAGALTTAYDSDGKPIFARRAVLLEQMEREINALAAMAEIRIDTALIDAYQQGYAGRAWVLDQATNPDIPVRLRPVLPTQAIRSLLLQPLMGRDKRYLGQDWHTELGFAREEFILRTKRSLTASMAQGEGMAAAMRRLRDEYGIQTDRRKGFKRNFYQTTMIARTEIMRASNLGALAVYEENADILSGVELVATKDERTCTICGALDGKRWKFGDPNLVTPPSDTHPGCILPGQTVDLPGKLVGASKSFYVGRAVEILLRSGRRIAITANHPVLTPGGWKRAEMITEADHLISTGDAQRIVLGVNPDDEYGPTVIEQVFNALMVSAPMGAARVKPASEYFYGDGRFVHGDISVVLADGFLLSEGEPALTQPASKHVFDGGGMAEGTFASPRGAFHGGNGLAASPRGFVGAGQHAVTLFGSSGGPAGEHGIGNGARGNTRFEQPSAQNSSGKPIFEGKGLFGFAGEVALENGIEFGNIHAAVTQSANGLPDDAAHNFSIDSGLARQFRDRFASLITVDPVDGVRHFDFAGHVFDLQCEPYQLYICNGIIVKNCRCTLVPVLIDERLMNEVAGIRETYSEWAARNGMITDGGLDEQRGAAPTSTGAGKSAREGSGTILSREDFVRRLNAQDINSDQFIEEIESYVKEGYKALRMAQKNPDDPYWGQFLENANLIEAGLRQMPYYDGKIYRGFKFVSEEEWRGPTAVGEIVQFKAMASFSREIHPFYAKEGHIVYEVIQNRSGVSIERLSTLPDETEVLVPSGTTYRVVSITQRAELPPDHPLYVKPYEQSEMAKQLGLIPKPRPSGLLFVLEELNE